MPTVAGAFAVSVPFVGRSTQNSFTAPPNLRSFKNGRGCRVALQNLGTLTAVRSSLGGTSDSREPRVPSLASPEPLEGIQVFESLENSYAGQLRYVPVQNNCVVVERRDGGTDASADEREGHDHGYSLVSWSPAEMREVLFERDFLNKLDIPYAVIGERDVVLYVAVNVANVHMDVCDWSVEGESTQHQAKIRATSLRRAIALLSESDASLAMNAKAMIEWHMTNRFCGSCGRPTRIVGGKYGGRARQCTAPDSGSCANFGRRLYPALAPSIMVLVHRNNGQECLLGRKSSWAPGRYSVLSGFCEVGEVVESTVCREVIEESGIVVCPSSVEYQASQFWAFPRATLLVGFYAAAVEPTTEINTCDNELEAAMWVGRDWLRAELRKPQAEAAVSIPGPSSLANKLILNWVDLENDSRVIAKSGC